MSQLHSRRRSGKQIGAMTGADEQVVIIGAGPYGLSVAAHLRARGIEPHVFGRPMSFWEDHMPSGMLLRSAWHASSIAHPGADMTLDAYERQSGPLRRPLPRSDFVSYGHWFQVNSVPDRGPPRGGPGRA